MSDLDLLAAVGDVWRIHGSCPHHRGKGSGTHQNIEIPSSGCATCSLYELGYHQLPDSLPVIAVQAQTGGKTCA